MIMQTYLNELADYTNNKIARVYFSKTKSITDFVIKATENNVLTIEYLVPFGFISTVTKVDFKDSGGQSITTRTVNVPIVEDTIMRHVLTIEEVV